MKLPLLRSPLPLRHAIPLIVLAFGLLWTGISTWLHLQSELAEAEERVMHDASAVASVLADASVLKLPDHQEMNRRIANSFKAVRWAVFVDENGSLVCSTNPEWTNKPYRQVLPDGAIALMEKALQDGNPHHSNGDGSHVWAVQPVPAGNEEGHHRAAIVQHDLTASLKHERDLVFEHALLTGAVQVVGCGILWWLLSRFLRSRMNHLFQTDDTTLLQAVGAKPAFNSKTDEFSEIFRVLKESGNRLDQIADNIEDVFFLTTPDKKVVYVSPAYARLFGRDPAELMRDSYEAWKRSVLEEYHDTLWHVSDPLLEGAPEVQCEFRIRRADGKIRWVELRMFPVRDERGGLTKMAGLSRDVTERKELEQEILNISERERRRIGNDIHDDLCQRLAAIKFKSEFIANHLKNNESPLAAQASEICFLMSESTKLCRGIARGLSPVDLIGEGFMVGMNKLVKATESLYDIPCFFYCPNSVMVESPSAAVHLYRISQEFLNNAVRHGNPTSIEVRLEMNAEFVRIEVTNDGKSFQGPGPNNQGMGLKIQKYRAAAIGAMIQIQPRSDGVDGTVATCIAPHSSCNPDTPSTP
ncbi:PAS domain S-box-containing protein [Roseimicrobium gellanilyticum]|uniref:PAS domain S-box-containing protein n=1 Tax=Roseimicrobium gellanilyticum TaxID=748857 RepID=A0A366HUN7_9BACT|nr:PAS domain S-box protein [Roseimicrobium gellanilyticum]RBP47215.1 PAS domain S-box-containing protein [Roseimicrobium gellanilyticum]